MIMWSLCIMIFISYLHYTIHNSLISLYHVISLFVFLQDSCTRVLLFRGVNKEIKNYNSQTAFQVRAQDPWVPGGQRPWKSQWSWILFKLMLLFTAHRAKLYLTYGQEQFTLGFWCHEDISYLPRQHLWASDVKDINRHPNDTVPWFGQNLSLHWMLFNYLRERFDLR